MDGKKTEEITEVRQASEEPQIIAQINIVTPQDALQAKIEAYTHCELCGTEMVFTHVTHFTYLEVEEEACCPHCNITTIAETHRLQ